jgi:hypothetical protein
MSKGEFLNFPVDYVSVPNPDFGDHRCVPAVPYNGGVVILTGPCEALPPLTPIPAPPPPQNMVAFTSPSCVPAKGKQCDKRRVWMKARIYVLTITYTSCTVTVPTPGPIPALPVPGFFETKTLTPTQNFMNFIVLSCAGT